MAGRGVTGDRHGGAGREMSWEDTARWPRGRRLYRPRRQTTETMADHTGPQRSGPQHTYLECSTDPTDSYQDRNGS